MGPRRVLVLLSAVLLLVLTPSTASAHHPSRDREPQLLASGLSGGFGSTIGPDGALYVTEPSVGEISRIDPRTGEVTTFASGLPTNVSTGGAFGGAFDVAFVGGTAYALVTFVSEDVGGTFLDGIYRIDGPSTATLVVDIGTWAAAHPPTTSFFVPTGVQYAFEPYKGGFLVTDGHHNRVYRVGLDGSIAVQIAFGNIVPTGLAVDGRTVFMAQAGPVPHLPQDGKVVVFGPWSTHRDDGRVGRTADGRRGAGPRAPAVRARAGRLAARRTRGITGGAGHRAAAQGRTARCARGRRRRPGPAGLVPADPRHGLRGHARWRGVDGRPRREARPPLTGPARGRATLPGPSSHAQGVRSGCTITHVATVTPSVWLLSRCGVPQA